MNKEINEIIVLPNQRSSIEWTSYLATGYAEGFEGEDSSINDKIEAWAVLIKTKLCYSLQGWFGRAATEFINKGFIDSDGVIDWEVIDDVTNRDNN